MSEKTHVDFSPEELARATTPHKFSKPNGSHPYSPSTSDVHETIPTADDFPDGGRGWLVVLGCVIFAATTLGWAYVTDL